MNKLPDRRSSSQEISNFLKKSKDIATFSDRKPRLVFAIDATASRQPTWDNACHIQQEMFQATNKTAALSIQLCYYRGWQDFFASHWLSDSTQLARQMSQVQCQGGHTQIARLLRHAQQEHHQQPVQALVFIGDAMEENADTLCQLAGQCGIVKLPLFIFQEGALSEAETTFRSMAKLSGGAYAHFDANSAHRLAALLRAVASYAAGGRDALEHSNNDSAKLLLRQLKN